MCVTFLKTVGLEPSLRSSSNPVECNYHLTEPLMYKYIGLIVKCVETLFLKGKCSITCMHFLPVSKRSRVEMSRGRNGEVVMGLGSKCLGVEMGVAVRLDILRIFERVFHRLCVCHVSSP